MKSYPIFLVIGVIGILFTLLVLAVGLDYYIGDGSEDRSEEENKSTGQTFLYICTPILLIPSVIFFYIGWRWRSQYERLKDVADILKAYRRIKLPDLANKLQRTERESEKLVLECIEEGMIYGYMDRSANAFFTTDYLYQVRDAKHGWKCSACGAYNDSIVLPGETAKCKYCGRVLPPYQRAGDQRYYSSPTPSPPQRPTPYRAATNCRWCGSPMVFISQYNRWYCNYCRRYV